MKTRIDFIKKKVKETIEGKKPWQVALLSVPIALGATGYVLGTGFIKNTENEETAIGGETQRISSNDFDGTIELTEEVNINGNKLFEDIMKITDHEFKDDSSMEKIESSKDDIASQVDADVHAHVQSLKQRTEQKHVEQNIIEAKESEKARLEAIKAKMIHSTDDVNNSKATFSSEEKLNILRNLGYVSPTRGRETGYVEIETKVEEKLPLSDLTLEKMKEDKEDLEKIGEDKIAFNTEEFIISSIEPIEEIIDHNELIADIANDFSLGNPEKLKTVTEEFELISGEVEKTIEQTLNMTVLKEPLLEFNSDIEEKQEEFFEVKDQEIKISTNLSEINDVEKEKIELDSFVGDKIEKSIEETNLLEKVEEIEEKDWCLNYEIPSTKLLSPIPETNDNSGMKLEVEMKSQQIDELFKNFKVGAKVSGWNIGPTVTTYEVEIDPGTKITKITGLEDNIKLQLQAKSIRIQAPIPGKAVVGIEVPNVNKKLVTFHETWEQAKDIEAELLIVAGQDVNGDVMTFDLAKTPHMLVAGSTGSGKSVAINTVLVSLMMNYTPQEVQMILVDPKMVEFTPYHGIPHLITPVITNASDANLALKEAVNIMEQRYRAMAENGARNIKELNVKLETKGELKLPYLVVIVDELADLMMVAAKEVEESIMRITQKARAAGIHMIVATQRPSTDVITGVIKSNIPSRIAFTVASSIDSRTILDQTGAEKLIGMGDMMMSLYGQIPLRGQGSYISSDEVEEVTKFAKAFCKPNYKIDVHSTINSNTFGSDGPAFNDNDPLYLSAKKLVIKQRKASVSLIQRYLSIGYNKAANIIDALENNGVIGPSNGSKPREVLISEE